MFVKNCGILSQPKSDIAKQRIFTGNIHI